MDRYTEDRNEELRHYRNLMEEHKLNVLSRFKCISKDEHIQEKFVQMLLDASVQQCWHAEDFISYFEIDELDKLALCDDLNGFINEYKEVQQGIYL